MPTREDLFPSKYIKHSDLSDREITLSIGGLEIEEVGPDREKKPVIRFKETSKRFVVNMTNYDAIAQGYGEETDHWSGKKVTLYADKARFGGKIVDCVRVRPAPEAEMDDQIPF